MKELKSKQRRYLMKLAGSYPIPFSEIGKSSLTPGGSAPWELIPGARNRPLLKNCFETSFTAKLRKNRGERTHSQSFRLSAKRLSYIKKAKKTQKDGTACVIRFGREKGGVCMKKWVRGSVPNGHCHTGREVPTLQDWMRSCSSQAAVLI